MSEEQTKQVVNDELTNRLNNSYDAKNYSIFEGSDGPRIMIQGERGNESVEILIRYDGIDQMAEDLKPYVEKMKKTIVQEPHEL